MTMKRLLFFFLFILATVSCAKDEQPDPVVEQDIQITGYFKADNAILESGRDVYWLPGDCISVCGAKNAFVADTETKIKMTSFSGRINPNEEYLAIYPYGAVTSWNGRSAVVNVPIEQKAMKGAFADDLNISAAKTSSKDMMLAFQKVLAYVKFSVDQEPGAIKSLVVKANGGETIAGGLLLSFDQNGVPMLNPVAPSSTVTLTSAAAWESGDYYVAMIPGKLTSGLTLTFTDTQGRNVVKTFDNERVLGVGAVCDLGTVDGLEFGDGDGDGDDEEDVLPPDADSPIQFLDQNVEILCIINWDTNGDNKLSYAEAAAVESIGTVFKGSTILSFDEFKYFTSVKKLEDNAFYECRQLRKLTLPKSIEEIGVWALCMMDALTEIVIPAAVTSMAELSLVADPSLEKIVVEEGNTVYDSRNNCNAVIHTESNRMLVGCKNTVIPDDILIIAQRAFLYSRIENIVIPDSVHTLEAFAFGDCKNAKTVHVGKGVKTWGSNVFNGCTGDFVINSNIPEYLNNTWTYSPFFRCQMSNVTFGPDVTSIGESAFPECTALSTIYIPETIQTLGRNLFLRGVKADAIYVNCREIPYYAFEGDTAVELTIGENVEIIGEGAFKGGGYDKLIIGDNVKSIGKVAFASSSAKEIVWGANIKTLGQGAFQMATIPSVYLPSVTSLSNEAFWACKNIQSAEFSDNLETIPYQAFADCPTLKEIKFPKSLKSIGGEAFEGTGLISINLPEGLKELANGVFDNCSSCQTVRIPSTVESINSTAFRGCTGELTVDCPLPSTVRLFAESSFSKIILNGVVKSIPEDAFFRCAELEEIVLPESLEEIGEGAFWECESLKKINLPSSLSSIGQQAFICCSSLESIVIPEKITVLNYALFRECTSLSNIVLPEGLKSIQEWVFSGAGLKEITIPKNVTFIGYYAFGMTNLTNMYCLPEAPPTIQEDFPGFGSIPKIYVPTLSVNNYKNHNSWKTFKDSIFAGDF